jgi:hypothetical protein
VWYVYIHNDLRKKMIPVANMLAGREHSDWSTKEILIIHSATSQYRCCSCKRSMPMVWCCLLCFEFEAQSYVFRHIADSFVVCQIMHRATSFATKLQPLMTRLAPAAHVNFRSRFCRIRRYARRKQRRHLPICGDRSRPAAV